MRWIWVVGGIGIASGCTRYDDLTRFEPDATPSRETPVLVHWQFENRAGQLQPCAAAYRLIEIVPWQGSFPIEPPGFACEDQQASVNLVSFAPNAGGIILRARADAGGEVFAERGPVILMDGVAIELFFSTIIDAGQLRVRWQVTKAGAPATCADVGVDRVSGIVRAATGESFGIDEACTSGETLTTTIPSGTATIDLTAGSTSGTSGAVEVPTGERTTDVPVITLAF